MRVDRDALGVPHIHAKTFEDAWLVQGYTTAEDRMFQMDGMRRLAGGDLAEIIGPSGLDSDHKAAHADAAHRRGRLSDNA